MRSSLLATCIDDFPVTAGSVFAGVGVCQAADICYSYAVFTGSGLLPFV
ncbi:hypothetical protein [Alcanivorax sp. MD8A]|nr:hypothetical protein [Alcanivorax sp. MD8A]MEE2869204.1 hypothetical protein [Pseudomonadota bacterium]